MSAADLITLLLRRDPTPLPASLELHQRWQELNRRFAELPAGMGAVDRAAWGGLCADRLAWAFLAGYQQALRVLDPLLEANAIAAFCVTEAGGNRPSDIRSALTPLPKTAGQTDGLLLNGEKTFVTGAKQADTLLIAAHQGQHADGRPRITLLRLPASREGISLGDGRDLDMVPELPHGTAVFREVVVSKNERLPGDGYAAYVKRFRTIEDIHVQAAICGYLLSVARRADWPRQAVEPLLSLLSLYRTMGESDPDNAATHLQLAGLESLFDHWLESHETLWSTVASDEALRWQRDKQLLRVAGRIRSARRERAWIRLQDAGL